MLAVAVLGVLVLLSIALRLAERVRPDGLDASGDPSPVLRAWRRWRAGPRKPPLPEGHRPPAGLGPLSPSERFLTSEAARGIRTLQEWLMEQGDPGTARA